MTRRVIKLIVLCSMVLSAVSAQAAGFGVYEYSARANALGNSVMAGKADPSSIAVNPAQVTQLEGTQIAIGASGIYPSATVTVDSPAEDADSYDGKSNIWTIPHMYVTHALSDEVYLGVGVFARFGLGTEFDENWAGASDVYDVGIKSVSFNPLIGYKVTKNFSVAIGPEIMWFDFHLKKKAGHPRVPGYLDISMGGDSWGAGVAVGARYQFNDWLSAGASYRSEVQQNVEGDISADAGNVRVRDTSASGKITLPEQLGFGINIKPTDKLSVEVGATWIGWSSYNELAVKFEGGPYVKKSDYKDTWRYNIGAEYNVNENWDVRASYIYDNSPLNSDSLSYMVPANDRQLFGIGAGWHNDNWSVDASYTYLLMSERSFSVHATKSNGTPYTQSGEFKNGDAQIFALTVGYKF